MKRSAPLKRNKPPRRARPKISRHKLWVDAEILSARLAHEAARRQGYCQNVNCPDNPAHPDYDPRAKRKPWQAHHVTYEQEIKRLGLARWNTENVLRLCEDCHRRHHHRISPVPLTCLRNDNYRYAFSVMGERAFNYLKHRYAGEDSRLEWWLGAWRHGRV